MQKMDESVLAIIFLYNVTVLQENEAVCQRLHHYDRWYGYMEGDLGRQTDGLSNVCIFGIKCIQNNGSYVVGKFAKYLRAKSSQKKI